MFCADVLSTLLSPLKCARYINEVLISLCKVAVDLYYLENLSKLEIYGSFLIL